MAFMPKGVRLVMNKLIAAAACALLVIAIPAMANDVVSCSGVPATRQLALQGHTDDMVVMGFVYSQGRCVQRDYTEAARWYRMAAVRGDAYAEALLGIAYSIGEGVLKDYSTAVSWFRRSAEQGNKYGQFNMGLAYYNGHGVPKNYSEAFMWFRKSADQGLASAQMYMGVCYIMGYGVRADLNAAERLNEAERWLSLSCSNGHGQACDILKESGLGLQR